MKIIYIALGYITMIRSIIRGNMKDFSMKYESYAHYSINQLEQTLETSVMHGLTEQEVGRKQSQFGLHQIRQSAVTGLSIFFKQFNSPFIYLLIGAAVLSGFLGDISNVLIISIIILINTMLSFIQEYRAEKTARLLAAYVIVQTHVIRDNHEKVIDNKQLVPGDIVLLNPGDAVPADLRLVEVERCSIDEAALTGESLPEVKSTDYPNNIAYMGTTVINGSAKGVVIATGDKTAFGHISMLTLTTPHESSFHYNIMRLTRFLIIMALIMVAVVIILNFIIKGSHVDILQLIGFSVALALSVTPEALPAVITSALTQSAYQLAQKKVIIKRLTSIEDLGSITLLCTDKTGTLTENVMTVCDVLSLNTDSPLFFASLASHYARDAFEAATYAKLSADEQKKVNSITILHEDPFDPVRRISIKRIIIDGQARAIIKGSVDAILENCKTLDAATKNTYKTWETTHGIKGQRALAIATAPIKEEDRSFPSELTIMGLIAFEDPIKSTVFSTVQKAQHLHVKLKILSGDGPEVTGAVAYKVGIIASPNDVITGAQLDTMTVEERTQAMEKYSVFARVTPEQKFAILQQLKQHETVGYLGDGINDAPALKTAHVGIAVAKATDIARSAADIVLVKKSLGSIIEGIYLGRKTFANTAKYLKTTLCSNIGNFYSIAIASLFIGFLPMLPIQILLVSLLSDAPMIAISTDNVDPEELRRPPHYTIREIAITSIFFAIISSFFDIILFVLLRHQPTLLQTMWYMMTLCEQIGFIFIIRTKKSIFTAVRPSSTLLGLSALALFIGLTLPYTEIGKTFFMFVHPTAHYVWIIVAIMSAYFVINECAKLVFYRYHNHTDIKS